MDSLILVDLIKPMQILLTRFDEEMPKLKPATESMTQEAKLTQECFLFNDKVPIRHRPKSRSSSLKATHISSGIFEMQKCALCPKIIKGVGMPVHRRLYHPEVKPFICFQCPYEASHPVQLSLHRKRHRVVRGYKCVYCTVSYETAAGVLMHIKQVHNLIIPKSSLKLSIKTQDSSSEKPSTCPKLTKCKSGGNPQIMENTFDEPASQLILTQIVDDWPRVTSGVEVEGVPSGEGLNCKYCDKVFRLKNSRLRHENFHTRSFYCHRCGRPFGTAYDLKRHQSYTLYCAKRQVGVRQRFASCTICSVSFKNQVQLDCHTQTKHSTNTRNETSAGRFLVTNPNNASTKFQNTQKLQGRNGGKRDSLPSSTRIPRKAAVLPVGFYNQDLATEGTEREFNNIKEYDMKLMTQNSSENSADNGKREFKCQFCDFRTLYRQNMAPHTRRLHSGTGQRNFKCHKCLATFLTLQNLGVHINKIHQNSKPQQPKYVNVKTEHRQSISKTPDDQNTNQLPLYDDCIKSDSEIANNLQNSNSQEFASASSAAVKGCGGENQGSKLSQVTVTQRTKSGLTITSVRFK